MAEYLNEYLEEERYQYLNFYLESDGLDSYLDPSPVYQLIFQRLRQAECEWVYSFPRFYIADFSAHAEMVVPHVPAERYSPEAALAKKFEKQVRQEHLQQMRDKLDALYNRQAAQATQQPPPKIVQAYIVVYGKNPIGWPPPKQ